MCSATVLTTKMKISDLLKMLGVERVCDAEKRCELVHDEAVAPVEGLIRKMAPLRCGATMVACDVGDDGRFLVRQSENLRRGEQIARVFVVGAQTDVHANIMQQCRHLQEQSVSLGESVLFLAFVEEPHGECGHMAAMRPVESKAVPHRFRARQDLLLEVGATEASLRRGKVEE